MAPPRVFKKLAWNTHVGKRVKRGYRSIVHDPMDVNYGEYTGVRLIEERELFNLSSCIDLGKNFTIRELNYTLTTAINRRHLFCWSRIMEKFDSDWEEVKKDPAHYKEMLNVVK